MNKQKQQSVSYFSVKTISVLLLFFVFIFFAPASFADNLTSSNFQIENPLFMMSGGQSSSLNFRYFSSTGEFVLGESLGPSFIDRLGFLYFPTATSPVVSATPDNGQITISWTPAVGTLADVTTYEIGISTSATGTYVYVPVGNVLTYVKNSLTNGITYYFKVRAFASGILLNESSFVSATPVAPSGGGGGGGGGGGDDTSPSTLSGTGVNFLGRAYPLSKVTILKDGQVAVTTIAGPDSNFSVKITDLSSGNYTFSVYGEDKNNIRSSLFTFPITITQGVITEVGGIFIAPTIAVDKSEVKKGENIAIFGQAIPSAQVTISMHSNQEIFKQTNTDSNGAYLYNFDTSVLELGDHVTKSKTAKDGQISSFGKAVGFIVGDKTVVIENQNTRCPAKADLNNDCKVNLVDYSIAAYWYKRSLSQSVMTFEKAKLNGDGKIDLIDFSIIAYYWTG